MDPVLLEDVYERLSEFPGFEAVELIKPADGHSPIQPDDILKSARDTITSRVLIMDVRNHTQARLQRAYSDIIRFNRPDFNRYCYTVLIGDGPRDFFDPQRGTKTLPAHLADLRLNYSAAAFFADPFLYYSTDEIQKMIMEDRNCLPERVSQRFEKYFQGDRPKLKKIRRHFRAASKQGDEKTAEKNSRRKTLKRLFIKLVVDEFSEDKELIRQALSKDGLAVPGETLSCNIYPFYFESRVLKVLRQAKVAK